MIVGPMRDMSIYDAPVLASVTRLANRLRREMREFDVTYLLTHCLNRLSENDKAEVPDFVKPLPWELLLIIKWLLTDSRYNETTRRIPVDYELGSVFGLLESCYNALELPVNEPGWYVYFRKLAFQQFKFQMPLERAQVSRQSIIFGHLELSHPIRRKFFELTRVYTFALFFRGDMRRAAKSG